MKKTLSVILTFIILFPSFCAESKAEGISAASYVILNADTLQVLDSRNMYVHRGMASTTKVMTAVLAVESGRLYEKVTIDADKIRAEGTSLGLKTGDCLTLYELVKGMLLSSGNDSANAVAYYLCDTLEDFASLMNEKARSIGMLNTGFVTPSGLDADGHYSCAYDMALLSAYALKDPVISEITSMKDTYVTFTDGRRLYVSNHNKLLGEIDGCIGLKTGYTKKSGRCLLSAVKRDSGTVVAVTLNAPDDWNDHKKMYDMAFGAISSFEPVFEKAFTVSVVGGTQEFVQCSAESLSPLSSFCNPEVKTEYYFEQFLYAPVSKGDIAGKAVLMADGITIGTVYFTADSDVGVYEKPQSALSRMINRIKEILSNGR